MNSQAPQPANTARPASDFEIRDKDNIAAGVDAEVVVAALGAQLVVALDAGDTVGNVQSLAHFHSSIA